jgi:hypothetical protein
MKNTQPRNNPIAYSALRLRYLKCIRNQNSTMRLQKMSALKDVGLYARRAASLVKQSPRGLEFAG